MYNKITVNETTGEPKKPQNKSKGKNLTPTAIPGLISMKNIKLFILGTIKMCGCRYIPPETKLLKFYRSNIAKIKVFGVR